MKFNWKKFFNQDPLKLTEKKVAESARAAEDWRYCAVGNVCHRLGKALEGLDGDDIYEMQKDYQGIDKIFEAGFQFSRILNHLSHLKGYHRPCIKKVLKRKFNLAQKIYNEIEDLIDKNEVEINKFIKWTKKSVKEQKESFGMEWSADYE
jgi:hypothetical protein